MTMLRQLQSPFQTVLAEDDVPGEDSLPMPARGERMADVPQPMQVDEDVLPATTAQILARRPNPGNTLL